MFTVDMTALPLEIVDGARSGQLDVSIYPTWLRVGLTFTLSVPISAAAKYVKVVVYDRQSDRVGPKTVTLK